MNTLRNLLQILASGALFTLLAGCTTGVSTDLAATRTSRSAIEHIQPIHTVRLDESFLLATDTYTSMGVANHYSAGKLWRSVFTGGADAPGHLRLEAHELRQHTNPAAYLVPMPSWISYKVTCILEIDGVSHRLRAEGKCGAYLRWVEGTRIAVDTAIADIAAQVQSILARASPRDATPATTPDLYDHLRKLKQLLDEGIITQDEFDARKQKLLASE